jgi:hypothetical protein
MNGLLRPQIWASFLAPSGVAQRQVCLDAVIILREMRQAIRMGWLHNSYQDAGVQFHHWELNILPAC